MSEPGADSLPLLEYALKEMWNKRQNSVFGHTLYEAVGKVEGAISRHADAVLHTLRETEQPLALRALTRLVRVAGDEGEADTRLRLPLGELSESERAVLQTFANTRLLVTKREEGTGIETIEVAHEALIRRWEKLRETLDSDREFLMWRRRLDSRRKAWEQKGRDNSWLLYGGERNDAEHWLNERGLELIAAEIEFITWEDRPDFQIERILSLSPSLLLFSDEVIRERWFATLVFCREKEKALSIAHEIEDADDYEQALRSIAEALAKVGMATEALVAAREIEYADDRAQALRSIAEALAKAGMATEAREAATEALAAAREIEDASARANALMAVVDLWLEQRQVEKARKLLEEMQNAISKVFEDSSRSEALRHLAVILARLHSYRAARETAEQCSSSENRLAAYTAIFREYHIERNPSLAPLFAEQVKEEADLG